MLAETGKNRHAAYGLYVDDASKAGLFLWHEDAQNQYRDIGTVPSLHGVWAGSKLSLDQRKMLFSPTGTFQAGVLLAVVRLMPSKKKDHLFVAED